MNNILIDPKDSIIDFFKKFGIFTKDISSKIDGVGKRISYGSIHRQLDYIDEYEDYMDNLIDTYIEEKEKS